MVTFHPFSKEERERFYEMCRALFTDGECYAFALALHRGLGFPLVGLMSGKVIRHAGVRTPGGALMDIRGEVSPEEFGDPCEVPLPYEIKEITEEDLKAQRPVQERAIENAMLLIEKIWPGLPGWRGSDFRRRAQAFMEGLEELSRKHGVFIRAPFPTTRPVLCDVFGDEQGYAVWPTLNNHEFFFDRDLPSLGGENT